MLPTVAARAITTYSHPGQLVLDPLAGVGTTLVEALHTGRHAVGVEYEPGFAALAAANLRHATDHGATGAGLIVQGDAVHMPRLLPSALWQQVALMLTSPPYGRTIHGRVDHRHGPLRKFADTYGIPDQASLAHRNLAGIRDGMASILAGCLPLLAPGATVVVTARPWRRDGMLVDLPGAVAEAATAVGLVPFERCVALLAAVRDSKLTPRHSFWQLSQIRKARARGIPHLLIAHEDILVYRHHPTSASSATPTAAPQAANHPHPGGPSGRTSQGPT